MIAAVIVLALALVFVIVVAVLVAQFLGRQLASTLADARRTVSEVRALHGAEIERLHQQYAKVIETQAVSHRSAVEHVMNLVNFGSPTKREAIVEEREPDAAVRAAREVDQQTIVRAMDSLRKNYGEIGVPVTEEELRNEATVLVTGGTWSPPASLVGLVRD